MSIYAKAMSIIENSKPTAFKKTQKYDLNDIDYDVHTRHCCKIHGCKYGENNYCTVVITPRRGVTGNCQTCYDRTLFDDDLSDSYDEAGWFF